MAHMGSTRLRGSVNQVILSESTVASLSMYKSVVFHESVF